MTMNSNATRLGKVTVERHNSKALRDRKAAIRASLRRECKHCGRPLPQDCRKDKQTCDDRCRKAWQRRGKTQRVHRTMETRICTWCLREFEVTTPSKKRYDRRACVVAASRARAAAGGQPLRKPVESMGIWG